MKHGASSLMEKGDKNDQTALHYAAYYGNIAVSYYGNVLVVN